MRAYRATDTWDYSSRTVGQACCHVQVNYEREYIECPPSTSPPNPPVRRFLDGGLFKNLSNGAIGARSSATFEGLDDLDFKNNGVSKRQSWIRSFLLRHSTSNAKAACRPLRRARLRSISSLRYSVYCTGTLKQSSFV